MNSDERTKQRLAGALSNSIFTSAIGREISVWLFRMFQTFLSIKNPITAAQDNFIVHTPFAKHRYLGHESVVAGTIRQTKHADQYAEIIEPISRK